MSFRVTMHLPAQHTLTVQEPPPPPMVPRIYEHFYAQRVFDIEEVKPLFPDAQQARNALHYAKSQRYIKRIKGGLYCVVPFESRGDATTWDAYSPDLFLIGSRLATPYYFSHQSALALYGLTEHQRGRVMVTSPIRFRPFEWQDTTYTPVHCRDFFGSKSIAHRDGLSVEVSDPEKTLLDCLQRFDLSGGLAGFYRGLHSFGFFNPPRLVEYLDRLGNQSLKVRCGFTLHHMRDRWEIPNALLDPLLDQAANGGPYYLDRSIPLDLCEHDPLWNLMVPKNFKELARPLN